MRVAFCSTADSRDREYWSGTPYFMRRHLEAAIGQLVPVGPLQVISEMFRSKQTLYRTVFDEGYRCELEPLLHHCLSQEVQRRVRSLGDIDVVFSPGCLPYPNTFLDADVPVVFWADATLNGLLDISSDYNGLCDENVWCGQELQRRMIDGTALAIYASPWAAESACRDYGADPGRVRVVPFGANLHFTVESEAAMNAVRERRTWETCRLLLVARDWQSRSGAFAVAVLDALEALRVPATLVVAGCQVPEAVRRFLGPRIEVHEIVEKDAGESERAYTALLASAHFLLHPSRGTCFGSAICEANAWALPALACRTGGVDSVIVDGRNGFGFAPTANPDTYAETIATVFSDREGYRDLCRSAWVEYTARLNWQTSARAVARLLEELA